VQYLMGDAIIYFSSLAYPANRATNPLDRVLFRCESPAWSEPVPTRIASATIHFTGQGQLLWVRVACGTVFGQRFSVVSMVSINLGIRFYRVATGDTGESIEPEESH
jgi:hypothetical protein